VSVESPVVPGTLYSLSITGGTSAGQYSYTATAADTPDTVAAALIIRINNDLAGRAADAAPDPNNTAGILLTRNPATSATAFVVGLSNDGSVVDPLATPFRQSSIGLDYASVFALTRPAGGTLRDIDGTLDDASLTLP